MSSTQFQFLNGLTFAALLFLVASGFTLIFGLMRIVNLAHGALYLMGGYVAYATIVKTGSFFAGIVSAAAALAIIGLLIDRIEGLATEEQGVHVEAGFQLKVRESAP